VAALAVLFVVVASNTRELTLAASITVWPDAAVTFTTMLTVKPAELASDDTVQVTRPVVAPTAGVLQEPALVEALTNLVPAGTLSPSVTMYAVFGQLLVTAMV
jgi:hypothetical protein